MRLTTPAKDFAAVGAFGSSPNVTVVAPEKGIKTLQQLVAAAKAKPSSTTHISAEILRFGADFEALHVPFRGMPEILIEIMSGRVDFTCSTIATALPFIREGKLVALAVSTPQRSSVLPEVPTTLEAAYKNSDYTFWTGLFAPAKTPREIVDKLAQETEKALAASGVWLKLAQQGGPDADHAHCLRCADQARDRFNSRLGQSGEPTVQLTGISRVGNGVDAAPQGARAQWVLLHLSHPTLVVRVATAGSRQLRSYALGASFDQPVQNVD